VIWPSASTNIDAPIDVVWAVMLDIASYGEWNPFVVRTGVEHHRPHPLDRRVDVDGGPRVHR